jgi:hypothetical protein
MCKRAVIGGFALLLLVLSSSATGAQPSYIAVFFGPNQQAKACPGTGIVDSLHVFLFNANNWVLGVEFAIDFPPSLNWVADLPHQDRYRGGRVELHRV